MSLRADRVADEIRDVLAACFQGGRIEDPRLQAVTITATKLSPDLQLASIYFRLYDDSLQEQALKGLQAASGFLKREIAKKIQLRRVPELRFFYDESVEKADKIEELLHKLRN